MQSRPDGTRRLVFMRNSAAKSGQALLILHGQSPTRSHNLDFLTDLLEPYIHDVDAIREEALVLTEYAVDARYPNRMDIDQDEAT
ncbi:MAG: HEPN domain-containing protein [Sulfobacillus sp.]|nr:HEPN domain-containing protein [Sulfobacillus sp.]